MVEEPGPQDQGIDVAVLLPAVLQQLALLRV